MNTFPWWHVGCFAGGLLLAGVIAFLMRLPVADLQAVGIVSASEYHPAYTTLEPQVIGKVTTFRTVHHPERWSILVAVPEIEIPHSMYTKTDRGQEVRIHYRVESVEHVIGNEE